MQVNLCPLRNCGRLLLGKGVPRPFRDGRVPKHFKRKSVCRRSAVYTLCPWHSSGLKQVGVSPGRPRLCSSMRQVQVKNRPPTKVEETGESVSLNSTFITVQVYQVNVEELLVFLHLMCQILRQLHSQTDNLTSIKVRSDVLLRIIGSNYQERLVVS